MQSVERRIEDLERRTVGDTQRQRVLIVDGDGDGDSALNEAKAKSIATHGPLQDGEEWFPVFLISGKRAA